MSVSSFSLSLEMFLLTSAEGVVEDGVAVDAGGGAVGSDVEARTGEDIAVFTFHSMLIVDCLVSRVMALNVVGDKTAQTPHSAVRPVRSDKTTGVMWEIPC